MVKLSAKKLVKKLSPHTLLRIQLQELDEDEIMNALIKEAFGFDALLQSIGVIERAVLRRFNDAKYDLREDFKARLAIKIDTLTNHAIPGKNKSLDKLRLQFMRACGRGVSDVSEKRVKNANAGETVVFADYEIMQAAFDGACRKFQSKIVRKCYGGKKKKGEKGKEGLTRLCKAFQVPLADFTSILDTLFEKSLESHPFKEIYDSLSEIRKIAEQIQSGDLLMDRLCWECSEVIDYPKICSACRAATYCGAVCQKQAWRNGHRFSCSSVHKIYENFTDNFKVIKSALADPGKHESLYGYRPNSRIDYFLLWNLFQTFPTDERDINIKLPSFKHFYSNLSQVKKGLLWCNHPLAIPDIMSANSLDFNDTTGLEHVLRNGLALSYRYPQFSTDGTMENVERGNLQLHANWLTGRTVVEHEVSVNCTPAEFLKAYLTWEHPRSYDRIFREIAESRAFQQLQQYDKVVGSDGLQKRVFEKGFQKKAKVHMELHLRHLQGSARKLQKFQKELVSARKSLMHVELKTLSEVVAQLQTKRESTVNQIDN
eukprot:scaffold24543_cov195-Amphora_coffeaeformis.AAC.2